MLSTCDRCNFDLIEDVIKDLAAFASTSPRMALRLANILQEHPHVVIFVDTLAQGKMGPLRNSIYLSRTPFVRNIARSDVSDKIRNCQFPFVDGRVVLVSHADILDQLSSIDFAQVRAMCSVARWDVRTALSLLEMEFPPCGVVGKVSTFSLFMHIASSVCMSPSDAAKFIVWALEAICDEQLGLFTDGVVTSLQAANFTGDFSFVGIIIICPWKHFPSL